MNKNDALQLIMRHAVAGHNNPGYTTFCNNPDHAQKILEDSGFLLCQPFGPPANDKTNNTVSNLEIERFEYRGNGYPL